LSNIFYNLEEIPTSFAYPFLLAEELLHRETNITLPPAG